MYKKCDNCGANNDPGERCDCKGAITVTIDLKKVQKITYDEAYKSNYNELFTDLKNKGLPSCIADDIANKSARKNAALIANATADVFRAGVNGGVQ